MQSYINLILEDLEGETPKKCYENLQNLIKENYILKSKVERFEATIFAIKESPDSAILGNLKTLLG